MIEFERVLGAFSHLAELDEEAARAQSPLVTLAIAEVSVMLKKSACTAENHERIYHACAAFAYYKYAIVCATRSTGFSAGDMRISLPDANTVMLAKQLRDDALGAIADLVDGGEFAFVQV